MVKLVGVYDCVEFVEVCCSCYYWVSKNSITLQSVQFIHLFAILLRLINFVEKNRVVAYFSRCASKARIVCCLECL